MKTQAELNQEFLEQAAALMPVAKGCITRGRNGQHVFVSRRGGKYRNTYLRAEIIDELRVAIANGRKLQALIAEQGEKLIKRARHGLPKKPGPGRPRKIIEVQPGPKRKPGRPKKIKHEF